MIAAVFAPSFAAAAGGDRGRWNVVPDPQTLPVEIKPGPVRLALDRSDYLPIFSPRPSRYVGVSKQSVRQPSVAQVYDMKNGEWIGKPIAYEPPLPLEVLLLSFDGRYLIVTGIKQHRVARVYSFETGQQVLTIADSRLSHNAIVEYRGRRQLVTIDVGQPLRQYDLRQGLQAKPTAVRPALDIDAPQNCALSYGGKYLACHQRQYVRFFDCDTGELAGEVELPSSAATSTSDRTFMAFSPDGSELALLCDNGALTMAFIAMKDGAVRVVNRWSITDTTPANPREGDAKLLWFPDQKFLLWADQYLVDPVTGAAFWQLPVERQMQAFPIRPLEVLLVSRWRAFQMQSAPIPESELNEALKRASAGGR